MNTDERPATIQASALAVGDVLPGKGRVSRVWQRDTDSITVEIDWRHLLKVNPHIIIEVWRGE